MWLLVYYVVAIALLSLLAGSVVWGFSWWPLKYFAASGLNGHAVSLTAYALVALLSLPFIWRERSAWLSESRWLAVIGLCFGVANVGLTIALMSGSVVRVMLLFFLLPAWGALGGQLALPTGSGFHLRGRLSQFASTNRQNTTNMMMTTVWVFMVVS